MSRPAARSLDSPSEDQGTGAAALANPAPVLEGLVVRLGALSQFGTIPENLRVLDLRDKKISRIDGEVLRACPRVTVLDLRKNTLQALPPEVSSMVDLEDLMLDQNCLREIPADLCRLARLKVLSVGQNELSSLPTAIGDIESLRTLTLGDNMIDEIPADLGRCSDLEVLHIHHNHFSRLPTAIGQLDNLTELALEWFRYTTPPLPRVLKGSEWKRNIGNLVDMCREMQEQGVEFVTCIDVLSRFSQKSFDPNAIDSKRRTRLHVACVEGHVGVAKSLADSGSRCDALDCEGYSPLLIAVREEHKDIAAALVKSGGDVNRGGGLYGSPLHVATVNFDPGTVNLLIAGKADVNHVDADGNTPLHVLMSVFDKGDKKASVIGQILLESKADCNAMNSDKWAPLHLAARRGQLRGISFALQRTRSSHLRCRQGRCVHSQSGTLSGELSARNNRSLSVCCRVFDINLRGGSHLWTPLHLAGHASHVPVVQVLLEAGADVFLRNTDCRTARHVSRGNLAISKLLKKAEDEWLWFRVHPDMEQEEPGSPEAGEKGGRKKQTFKLGEEPASEVLGLNVVDVDDPAEALATGSAGAKSLNSSRSDAGADSGSKDAAVNGGATGSRAGANGRPAPLPKAPLVGTSCKIGRVSDVHYGKAELLQLQQAAFLHPMNSAEEFTAAVVKLAEQGARHRLMLLLSRSWVKDMLTRVLEDEKCHEMLLHPGLVGNEDAVRVLLDSAPRERLVLFGRVRNKERETWLHALCKGASIKQEPPGGGSWADVLAMPLTICPPQTFDLEARDNRGQTPLHLVAQCGNLGLLQVLLDSGGDPNAREDTSGWTPLHCAVAKGHYALILQLLHHEATKVDQVDNFDWNPLLEACSRLDARCILLLLNGGANLGFRTEQYDVLKAVDVAKKDLAAKRWMSCLLASNGFNFQESRVQLAKDDVDTLARELAFYEKRTVPIGAPPFHVPDHLAPRCYSCKVLFSVGVRRYPCRSCGLVFCGTCAVPRPTRVVALDERPRLLPRSEEVWEKETVLLIHSADTIDPVPQQAQEEEAQEEAMPELESEAPRHTSGTSLHSSGSVESANSLEAPKVPPPVASSLISATAASTEPQPTATASSPALSPRFTPQTSPTDGEDLFDELDPAEEPSGIELPASGPPASLICPANQPGSAKGPLLRPKRGAIQGALIRERGLATSMSAAPARTVRLCAACTDFFKAGVGETYAMMYRGSAGGI